ncbi:MAG: DNA methyltransferase, partial [Pyrinomonadaceae bacterium]
MSGAISAVIREDNKLRIEDRAAHDWYRFVLSYPAHLVRDYIDRFGVDSNQIVLDPFCGTGTTLVECKKRGIPSIGIESNSMACLASRVKVDWKVDPKGLLAHAEKIAHRT